MSHLKTASTAGSPPLMLGARLKTNIARCAAIGAVVAAMALGAGVSPAAAAAVEVTAVNGSAYGYYANITLFGGHQTPTGPTPTVSLAQNASNSPQTATASTGIVQYTPATFFTSDRIDVSTQGSLGTSGSVTSSSTVTDVNRATTQSASTGSEILTAGSVSSTCTADASGVSRSATFAGPGDAAHTSATLRTSEGDPNVDGDETYYDIPTNPTAGTTVSGTVESVGDRYHVVFNEQITNPDGSLTVNAAHEYLEGPAAVGDVIVGQSVCGVTLATVSHADLGVTIADSPDPVATAGTVTYTVAVSNTGVDPAAGVTLSNVLSGAKLVSATPTDAGDTCTVVHGKNKGVICSLGTMGAGGSDTVTIVAQAPHKPGTVSLTSTASTTSTDGNPANNSATESTTAQKP